MPSPRFEITIDGSPLGAEPEQNLLSVSVQDNLNLPDTFEFEFIDPYRSVVAGAGFSIGSKVEIAASDEPLLSGEVTALEATYDPGLGARTRIRGLDHSHRLFRGRHTRTYNNEAYSDIARTVAQEAGLSIGTIDASATPQPEQHVSQANVNDWQFVRWLAAQSNRVAAVRDGNFEFRAPDEPSEAPSTGTYETDEPRLLIFGHNLLRFRSIVTSAEQVQEVEVRGWDVEQKKELVATAQAKTTAASISVEPDELAGEFGSGLTLVATDTPYGAETDLDAVAAGLADRVASAFAEFDGVSLGSPALKAGAAVRLQDVGEPFDGEYLLTSSRHVWTPETGYRTAFTVTGQQDRSLLGLAAPGLASGTPTPAGPRITGVVSGIVTDATDPKKSGRVKLKFPWLSDDYVSDWARSVQIGAGDKRGGLFVPEVNDEVLVAFDRGDVRRPFVLGGLYNGVDKPSTEDYVDGSSGAVKRREFVSRQGHVLSFDDAESGDQGLRLATGDGSYVLHLDQQGAEVRLNADSSQATVTIVSGGDVTISATGNCKVEGREVAVEAQSSVTIKGQSGVSIDGGAGAVEVKGSVIKLN